MKKRILLLGVLVLLIICSCFAYINYNIVLAKQSIRIEAERYLKEKYDDKMVVYETSLSDIKVARVYPSSNPDLKFNLLIYSFKDKPTEYIDQYLIKCLENETATLLKKVFSSYDIEIQVSNMKWYNPTQDGQNETYRYLDNLYTKLGRIPHWKDVNEYQKIEEAKVTIKKIIDNEREILPLVQQVKETGCHIENFQIKDVSGQVFSYTF